MARYADYTDQQLLDEIAEYRTALKAVSLGGGVGVVAGEGRRMEITRPDSTRAERDLRDLIAELRRRPGYETWGGEGGAIPVEIG